MSETEPILQPRPLLHRIPYNQESKGSTLKQSTAEPAHIPKGYTQAISSKENRANGRNEKRIVAIEDSNSKALVATDNNEDIDWTKEFDAEPVTYAMMALTEVEQDDWSMEFDAEHVHFGQDGLGDFDWSNKADDTPVSLALMATNSEVPYCSKCSKSYKKLLESYQTERDNFQKARTEILGYQMSLESLEVILKTHEKNEYAWGDKYEQMEYDLKSRDLKLEEKQKELDQALKERDDFKVKLEKWSNASVLQNEVLNKQRYLSDKSCIGFGVESSSGMESDNSSGNTNSTESLYPNFQKTKGFHSVPPPTGTIIPPRANVSFTGIDELAIRNKVLNQENTKSSQPEIDRNKVIIEDWVDSDDEETVLNSSETQKKTVFNSENSETSFETRYLTKGGLLSHQQYLQRERVGKSIQDQGNPEEDLKDYAIIDSGCSGSMTGDKDKLSDFKEFKGGYVAFGNDSKGGRISGKGTHQDILHRLLRGEVSFVEELKFNLLSVLKSVMESRENIRLQGLHSKMCCRRKNRTLIEAARTILADSLLPIQFWAEAVNTACYVLNRVLVTKPQMKTPYEILMGRSPNISFMRPFGCPLTILNTLDHLGKFDGKSEEGYLLIRSF
ncbi:ribonuclease H-like domain-containing protein [Tanacetum coccineum]|uniref:Ribonuclease H-like domain-containing protein n=1 Tax=Tanacetum coccineum TaxID=301880 RepID=A0ABQ5EQE9_9ASTR